MIQDEVPKQNEQFYDQVIKILTFMKDNNLNFVFNQSSKNQRFTIAEDIAILYENYKKFKKLQIEQYVTVPPPLQRKKESVKQRRKKLRDATKENLMHILEFLKKEEINLNHFSYEYKQKSFVRLDQKNLYKKGGKGYQTIRQSQTKSNQQNDGSQQSSIQQSLQRNRQQQNLSLKPQSPNQKLLNTVSSNSESLIPQSSSININQPKNFKIRDLFKFQIQIEELYSQLIRWEYKETQKFSFFDDLLIMIELVAFQNLIKFQFCKRKLLKQIQERKKMLKGITAIDLKIFYTLIQRINPNDLQLIIEQGGKITIIEKEINKKMIVQNKPGSDENYRLKNAKQESKLKIIKNEINKS